ARWMQNAVAAGIAVCGAFLCAHGHASPLPFAAALLLAVGDPAAWRVIVAAGFALAAPGFAPVAAVILLALAFSARHLPPAARWLLSDYRRGWTVSAAALSSVACAAYAAVLDPSSFALGALLAG